MLQKKGLEIPICQIFTNPDQPRKNFSDDELQDLKDSILSYGVLQPIIVKKDNFDGKYFLIAGERRLRAVKLAGFTKIPAIVKDFDERDAAIIAVVENVQREDLSFIEEAYAYKKLIDDYGMTQSELALKIGKKQSTISNKMRILALPKEMQEKIVNASLTERHARALLKIEDDRIRNKVLNRVIDHHLNVKQTEKIIEDLLEKENEEKKKKRKINYISYKIYMNTIHKAFAQVYEFEKGAKLSEEDKGDYVEVKIMIPKNNRCFT